MYICAPHMCLVPLGLEEVIGPPGSGVSHFSEPPSGCWESNLLGPLKEQPVHLLLSHLFNLWIFFLILPEFTILFSYVNPILDFRYLHSK